MTACKKQQRHQSPCKVKSHWRWWDYLFFSLSLLLLVMAIFAWQLYSSNHSFSKEANVSLGQMLSLYQQASQITPKQNHGITNMLLLGNDQLDYRYNSAPLCDTIMVASINWQKHQVSLLSLPRDLTLPGTDTKINALYALHYHLGEEEALAKTANQLSELLNLHFDYYLMVTMADVADFLSLIDGVEVEIVNSFTDDKFPRTDVDINKVFDPALLYETISFEQGWQTLDPEAAIKFMRSRHAQGIEGSDYARSRRQQLVINAAANKVGQIVLTELKQYQFTFLAKLYQFYQQHFANQLEFPQTLSLLIHLLAERKMPTIINNILTIGSRPTTANLVEVNHKYFQIQITNLAGLRVEVKQKLSIP